MTEKKHTIASLIQAWKDRVPAGHSVRDTADPVLLAGCYLEWAGGNLERATNMIQVHCSGQYVDCPRFAGCDRIPNGCRRSS